MAEPDQDSWTWRLVFGSAPALAPAVFLFDVREVLAPFPSSGLVARDRGSPLHLGPDD